MAKYNYSKQTRYFRQKFNHDTLQSKLEEIILGRDNWWYVQVDATIRYAFVKYKVPIPKYVIVEEIPHFITFKIYRENLKNVKDLKLWNEKWLYIHDELKHQFECNSSYIEEDEHWVKYEFKLL